jgi:hypothetical protein
VVKKFQLLVGSTALLVGLMAGAAPAGATTSKSVPAGTTGADVSWPQCDGANLGSPPSGASFGIVGVNDGLAGTENPCLSAELSWEASLTYRSPVQVYVNTADPGNGVPDWPTENPSGPVNPYGTCSDVTRSGAVVGGNTRACAWAYGYDKATQDLGWVATSSSVHWWLDVEVDNSWQSGKKLGLNEADIDGMVAAFPTRTVGVFSTSAQWSQIVGTSLDTHSHMLGTLPEWIPTGANTASTSDCTSLPAFTTGAVKYVQFTTSDDYDIACT